MSVSLSRIIMKKGFVFFITTLCGLTHASNTGDHQTEQSPKAWQIGAQALYLQPRYTGYNQFGTLSNAPLGEAPTQLAFQSVDDAYRWGFRVEGGYHFRGVSDINLNWSHYHATTNRGVIVVPTGSSFTDSENNAYAAGRISTSRQPTWDSVNAELGQMVQLSQYNNIRFHGGVQYARINTQVALSEPDVTDSTTSVTQALTYSGFGPRLGLDMSYLLHSSLAMYANGAMSLLIGPNQFRDTGVGSHNTLQWVTGSSTAIIPELEARLGVKYTYIMTPQSELLLDIGWMWNNYFSSQVNNHATDTHESDFGLQGLFLGIIINV